MATLHSLADLNRQVSGSPQPAPQLPSPAEEVPPFSLRQLNEAAQSAPPPPEEEPESGPGAITRGFVSTLIGQNPALVGEAFEGISLLSGGNETFDQISAEFRRVSELSPDEFEVQGQRLSEIGGLGEGLTFIGEQLGSGLGSMVPSLISGTAGGALASRIGGRKTAVAGSLAGAALPSAVLNFGDLFQALKAEDVEPLRAAELAAIGAGPITALDVGGVAGPLSRFTGTARQELTRSLARRLASEFGKGALVEGATESIQQLIQEGIAAFETGDLRLPERAENVAAAGIGGAVTGGTVRGAAGVIPDRPDTLPDGRTVEQALADREADRQRAADATPGPPDVTPPSADPVPAPQGARTGAVFTSRGTRVDTRAEIVEADALVASQTDDLAPNPAFPAELQPRERTRAASQAQIAEIAGNLNPQLLGLSPSATEGAPIIGPDNVVESGNARALAIRRAYASGQADAYRAFLDAQGFETSGFRNPVLVMRRTTEFTPEQRQAFTREANERTTLDPSAAERATADAQAMPAGLLDLYRGGELNAAANRQFIRGFIESIVPTAERGSVLAADGSLSQAGLARVENALFARAFGDNQILASLREQADTNIRAIGGALIDTAPAWARFRANVASGQSRAELDITTNILEATRIVRESRRRNVPVGDLLRQGGLFEGGASPETVGVLRLMFRDDQFRRAASRPVLANALRFYVDQAERSEAGPGLIDLPPVRATDILSAARSGGQGALLPNAADSRTAAAPEQATLPEVAQARNPPTLDQLNAAAEASTRQSNVTRNRAGDNYVGFRSDVFDPSVAPAVSAPLRREVILADLMKALGVPLYQGRVKGRGVLGFFRMPIEEVRVKKHADIETTAHEAAHLLDSRIPEIRQQWYPATAANAAVREELRGVSYDRTKLYEGFAEFVRLWATQTDQARTRAPQFFAWFEAFVERHPIGPALRQMQEQMNLWFAQSALDRAKSKVGQAKDINEFLAPARDQLRQSVLDDLHGILRMERDLSGAVNAGGAYETARLLRGKTAIVEGALTIGAPVALPDGDHAFQGKSLRAILDPVVDRLEDFLMYAVGRSARELKQQGRENLFTDAEIQGMLALNNPAFRRAFEEYQAWNNAILDFAQAKGIINPEVRARWRRTQYIPFHRVSQRGSFFPGSRQAVPGDWRGIRALTGGTQNIRDVLENMIRNATMLIDAALTNEARQKVARLAARDGGAKFMARIGKDTRAVRIHLEEVRNTILRALGVFKTAQLPPEAQVVVDEILDGMAPIATFFMRGQAPSGPEVVAVLRRGEPTYYEVEDPILYRSLSALNRPAPGWILRLLAAPKRIGQASITLALDFMTANFARDTLSASIYSRNGFRPLVDSAIGIKSRITQDANYRDFIANGGGFSSYLLDEHAFRAHLHRFYGRRGINYRTILDAPMKLILALERIADAVEMSARLGEFRRARQKGASRRAAAFQGREVSTDFAMRGDSQAIGFLYDTIIFLKAGMNGIDRFYRGMTSDPQRMRIAAKAGLVALFSAGLYALNRGNPLFDQLEDWDRDVHWHFFVPTVEAIEALVRG